MQLTILRDLSVFWGMFHVIFLFLILFQSRYTKKKTIWMAGAGMGLLMGLNAVLLVVHGVDFLGRVFLFTCAIPSFSLFYVMSEKKRFRFLLTFCLADTCSLWVMAVTNLLDYYLGGGKFILMFISRLLAFPILEYSAYRYLRKPYLELQDSVEKGWGIFAGMTALYYVLLTVVVNYPVNIVKRPEDVLVCALILILMAFNYATIFFALYNQILFYRKQQSERILLEQNHSLENQLESQQRVRKMKHDMKGHTVVLSGLLGSGKYEEASEYLEHWKEEMDALSGQYCANPYIDVTVSYFSRKFEKIGAVFRPDIQIGEESLPYMEICRILSNALENAYDATKELPKEKRQISVQMKYRKDYLIIRVKNCCREGLHVEKGTIPPTEKGGMEHGFGLPAVQETAEKLAGGMLCYTESGNFVLDVMVRVKQK